MRPEPPPEPPGVKLTSEPAGMTDDAATGEIVGAILDHRKEPVIGTTVVATSLVMTGEIVTTADEGGRYVLEALTPGRYTLTFYFLGVTYSGEVTVESGRRVRVTLANWKQAAESLKD